MEYLHEFTTQAQCDAYMNGEDYKEPFTAFVSETSGVSYNAQLRLDLTWDGESFYQGPNLQFAKDYYSTEFVEDVEWPYYAMNEYSGCPIYVNGVQIPEYYTEEGETYRNITYDEFTIRFWFSYIDPYSQEEARSDYEISPSYDKYEPEHNGLLKFIYMK
jgi:hypothetical protein